MGKNKLITGMVVGAIIGGAVSLINQETRNYVKQELSLMSGQMGNIVQNPSHSIRHIQNTLIETAENAASSLDGALNAVGQIENTINEIRSEDKKKLN